MRPRAVVFDFNGTLSHDEPLWFEVYSVVFAAHGRPIARDEYFGQVAGLSDEEAVATWLGPGHPDRDRVVEEAVTRFRELARDGSTVPTAAREALVAAAALVPVGIVTTARRAVLDEVLAAAGLIGHVGFTITAEDVSRTKPDPEGYLLALERLDGVAPGEVLAFEDTPIGVEAAQAAGMRCIAVLGTVPRDRLAGAEEILDRLDAESVLRLLG